MLKSNKGYSLIEIGVGILILTVFLIVSIGLFNGCYTNYRRIKQRNIAINRAVYYMENMLQTDSNVLTGFFVQQLNTATNIYALTPNQAFQTFVKNRFNDFKERYAFLNGLNPDSVGVLSDDEIVDYIFADTEFLINAYIKDDAKTNASATQLQNGTYGFLTESGRFSGDTYEIEITQDPALNGDANYPENSTVINANGGAFKVVKSISRIPSTSGTAFGNNVLRLRVDVYYTYDFSKTLTDENMQVISLDTIKT